MFAILAVITPEGSSKESSTDPSNGFRTPFPDLQWLSVHNRQPVVDNHRDVLYRLSKLKDGIDALRMAGFAEALQFVDIVFSTSLFQAEHE